MVYLRNCQDEESEIKGHNLVLRWTEMPSSLQENNQCDSDNPSNNSHHEEKSIFSQ